MAKTVRAAAKKGASLRRFKESQAVQSAVDKDFVVHVLGGKVYHLACTWGALKAAQGQLRAQGIRINLLLGLSFQDVGADMLAAMFYAFAFQQDKSVSLAAIDAALGLLTWEPAFVACADAYRDGMAREVAAAKKANPTQVQPS